MSAPGLTRNLSSLVSLVFHAYSVSRIRAVHIKVAEFVLWQVMDRLDGVGNAQEPDFVGFGRV